MPKIPDNRSQNQECTVLTQADAHATVRDAICDLAGARHPGETIKSMLYRASRAAGFSASRIKRLYYGEVQSPAWHEVETLRQKAKERRETRARWQDLQRDAEIAAIRARLERLERDDETTSPMVDSQGCELFEVSGEALHRSG